MASFNITVVGPDPDGRIARAADSAAAAWSRHIVSDASFHWQVTSTTLPANTLGWGSSTYTASIGPSLWEPQLAHLLRTGIDTTPDAPDAYAKVDLAQIDAFGADLTDVLTHELGHALFADSFGGGENKTPFDALVVGGHFTGSAAQAIYGGPVPVTGPHFAVSESLMYPAEDAGGHDISLLDLAVLNDLGVPTRAVFGTKANDALTANRDGTHIAGGYGADTLAGKQGADTLDGGEGNDSIRGGKSGDVLSGSSGADTLAGDLGDDTLCGGEGSDLFIFRPGDGCDVIDRFEVSDRIQLPGPYSVSIDQASMETRIAYEGGTVTLSLTTAWQDAWVAVA